MKDENLDEKTLPFFFFERIGAEILTLLYRSLLEFKRSKCSRGVARTSAMQHVMKTNDARNYSSITKNIVGNGSQRDIKCASKFLSFLLPSIFDSRFPKK